MSEIRERGVMETDLTVLFTVHFLTFMVSEILILIPFFGWYLLKFTPANNYFHNANFEQFLYKVAEEYMIAAPYEAGSCLFLLEVKSDSGEYQNLKELRTAALVRSFATVVAGMLPPIALFI